MWNRIFSLIIKELLTFLRDRKARVVLIFPPLLQLFVFSFAATLEVKNIPMGILNLDNGKMGFELAQRFHGSPTFSRIIYLHSNEEIASFIDEQKGMVVLVIDQDFSRRLSAQQPAKLQLILDGRKSNSAQIIAGYVQEIVYHFNNDLTIRLGLELENSVLVPRNWFNPNLIYQWFNLPSLCGILTMLVSLIVTALSVARERELGTFDQLLVSPASPLEIVVGKAVPALLIALVEGSIIIAVSTLFFKVPMMGSLAALYCALTVFCSSIIGIGLFISSLCSTQQQAVLGTFVFMSPAVILSGFATPIENMPTWLQPLTYLNPLRYMMMITRGIFLKGMPWGVVLNLIWPMALIAFFTLTVAAWLFRKRLQ